MTTHTPGPWVWRTNGNSLLMWGDYGMRPVVLDVGRVTGVGRGRAIMRMRDDRRDVMVEATPDHPDARLIAASPTLLAALEALVSVFGNARTHPPDRNCHELWEAAEAAIAKAKGTTT